MQQNRDKHYGNYVQILTDSGPMGIGPSVLQSTPQIDHFANDGRVLVLLKWKIDLYSQRFTRSHVIGTVLIPKCNCACCHRN